MDWELTEQKLYAIHSISGSNAGEALRGYIRAEMNSYQHKLVHEYNANDAASIAYAQAAIRIGEALTWLLSTDMAELLKQHGFPPEDSDHEDEEQE